MASARIKEYTQRTTTPLAGGVPDANAPAIEVGGINAATAGNIASGARNLAFSLKEREEEQARAWTADALAKARLEWSTQLVRRQEQAKPGASGFTPGILADFDTYSDSLFNNAPSDSARFFLQERMSDLRSYVGSQAEQFEAQARVDWRDDTFKSASDNVAKLMNTDPNQYKVALAELLATIDSSAMPPVKKSARREATVNQVSGAAVWSQIQRSPTAFLQSIGFYGEGGPEGKRRNAGEVFGLTGNAAFDALPFERRTQALEQALKLKAQTDADADRLSSARKKELGEEAMKEGWSRFYGGKLTKDYIESVRALVSDNDYKSLLEAHRKGLGEGRGGNKTDPGTFNQLQRLIAEEKWSEAQQFAFTSHRNGLLSNDHLSSNLERIRSQTRQEGPKSQYERSRNFIRGKLEPGPMVQDPAGRARVAEALDTFDAWYASGPGGKRTDEEVGQRGREIVNQFSFISFDDSVLSLTVPRGTSIRRTTDIPVLEQDIRVAGQTLKRKRDNKELTPGEYDLEMVNLKKWIDALNKAKAAAAVQQQPGGRK